MIQVLITLQEVLQVVAGLLVLVLVLLKLNCGAAHQVMEQTTQTIRQTHFQVVSYTYQTI
jgi:hypothetical protein